MFLNTRFYKRRAANFTKSQNIYGCNVSLLMKGKHDNICALPVHVKSWCSL